MLTRAWLKQSILQCVKWPYQRRVDAAHAWGMAAVGTAGLVAIPTILATLHATDDHFRWWWPTNWMIVPAAIFLVGLALTVLPVMRPVNASTEITNSFRATVAEGNSNHISRDDNVNGEPLRAVRPRRPLPKPGPDTGIGKASPVAAQVPTGHAFISYVREDASRVDQLQRDLEVAGVSVWRDTADLWPGEDWRTKIRRSITGNTLVFIACFSSYSTARVKSRQNEELALAIDQLRTRRPDVPWLIPVRFDDCSVPDYDLGAGRTLASIQGVDLFGEDRDAGVRRLMTTVRRLLEQNKSKQETGEITAP
jgi:hypothetical protein